MEKKSSIRLGLDIGTSSIGWALTEHFELPDNISDEELAEFDLTNLLYRDGKPAVGVRVIPTITKDVLNDFNKGQSVSKCKDRTQKRGARRLLQRYRARRERLLTVLKALGWIPSDFPVLYGREYTQNLRKFAREGKKYPDCALNALIKRNGWEVKENQVVGSGNFAKVLLTPEQVRKRFEQMGKEFGIETIDQKGNVSLPLDWLVFYLRHIGTREPLSNEELALVLYNLNQKRGFKSSKRSKEEDKKEEQPENQEEKNKNEGFKHFLIKEIGTENLEVRKKAKARNYVLLEDFNNGQEFKILPIDKDFKQFEALLGEGKNTTVLRIEPNDGKLKYEFPKSTKNKPQILQEWVEVVSIEKTDEKWEKKNKRFDVYSLRFRINNDTKEGRYSVLEGKKPRIEIGTRFLEIKENTIKDGQTVLNVSPVSQNAYTQDRDRLNHYIAERFEGKDGDKIKSIASLHLEKILETRDSGEYNTRNQIIFRKWYIAEFHNIWDTQENHLRPTTSEEIEKILSLLYTNDGKGEKEKKPVKANDGKFREIVRKGALYKNDVRNAPKKGINPLRFLFEKQIIYYQRDLKSQRKSIADCERERNVYRDKENRLISKPIKVAPASSPIAQEFTVWNEINKIKYSEDIEARETDYVPLPFHLREKLFEHLSDIDSMKASELNKILFGQNAKLRAFNFTGKTILRGNTTRHALLSKVPKHFFPEDHERLREILANSEKFELLWHLIASVDCDLIAEPTDNPVVRTLKHKFGFSEKAAVALSNAKFKDGYANMSAKAMRKILSLMRCGKYFDEKAIPKEVKENLRLITEGKTEKFDKNTLVFFSNELAEAKHFQGLPYYAAASLIYGSHSREEETEKLESFEQIKTLKQHSLRNPLVEKIVNEVLMLVKDIWKTYGRPDEIIIEMAREMRQNAKERQSALTMNTRNRKENDKAKEELKRCNVPPTAKNILKYRLWRSIPYLECNESTPTDKFFALCLYTGRRISFDDVFGDEMKADRDHIIPQSRFFDDSFANQIIVFREANEAKSNMTAYDYMNNKGEEAFQAYLNRVNKYFPFENIAVRKKRKYLLMPASEIPEDFINRQLNETRYITKKVKQELAKVARVRVTSGGITDYLRHIWGVDNVMKELVRERYEALEARYNLPGKLVYKEMRKQKSADNKEKEYEVEVFEGFSKRLDHRHHALDAIVIACTRQSHIQLLNFMNALISLKVGKGKNMNKEAFGKFAEKLRRETDVEDLTSVKHLVINWTKHYDESRESEGRPRFQVPWRGFGNSVLESLKQTMISVKSKKEQRGRLHDENPSGEVWVHEEFKIPQTVGIVLNNLKAENAVTHMFPSIYAFVEATVKQVLEKFEYDKKRAEQFLSKNPILTPSGKQLDKVHLLKRMFISNKKWSELKSFKSLNNIADKNIRRAVFKFFFDIDVPELKFVFGKKKEEAEVSFEKKVKALLREDTFSEERVRDFNEYWTSEFVNKSGKTVRRFPIKSLKTYDSAFEEDSFATTAELGYKKFYTKGGNYLFLVKKETGKNGKRTFASVPLIDLVKAKTMGKNIYEQFIAKNEKLLFSLWHDEIFFVPEFGKDIAETDWNDIQHVASRCFRVKKFSGDTLEFMPLMCSEVIAFKEDEALRIAGSREALDEALGVAGNKKALEEIGTNGLQVAFKDELDSAAKYFCHKLLVDRLGRIEGYWNEEGEFVSVR